MLGKYLRIFRKKFVDKYLSNLYLGLSPNTISFIALILSFISIYFLMIKEYIIALLFITSSLFLDILDGAIARNKNNNTRFGAYLDPMLDKFAESFIYFGLFLSGFKIESFLALTGILLIGSAKSWAFLILPLKNFDWPAIGERADRYLVLLLSLLIANFYESVYGVSVMSIALWLIIVIVYTGTIQRILFARKLISKKFND